MTTTADLYDLLPAIYRITGRRAGGALEALTAVLAAEADVVDRDIAGPVRRLVHRDLRRVGGPVHRRPARRARPLRGRAPRTCDASAPVVANTIALPAAQGHGVVLEQLAATSPAGRRTAVEFFQLLATTQYVNHVRLGNSGRPACTPTALELLDGPFDRDRAHRPRCGTSTTGRGRYNIPNIGVFLWRLQSYPVERGTAGEIGPAATSATPSTRSGATSRSSTGRRRRSRTSRRRSTCPSSCGGARCSTSSRPAGRRRSRAGRLPRRTSPRTSRCSASSRGPRRRPPSSRFRPTRSSSPT